MLKQEIPAAFVWTKIQAEAGEPVDRILNRKELERLAGGGQFWWGVGESKASAIGRLRVHAQHPAVLFSLMLTPPQARDSLPDSVVVWQAYEVPGGEVPLPPAVVVTSRAHASNGEPKRRHYALVCESSSSLLQSGGGAVDAAALRNLGGAYIGSSQVTAVVEQATPRGRSLPYPVTARATLSPPYFVTLRCPRRLSDSERRLLVEVGADGRTSADWAELTRTLGTRSGDRRSDELFQLRQS